MKQSGKSSENPKFTIFVILAAFCFVVIVNAGYIFLAKKTWRGVVEENGYQIGLHYNEVLAQKKQQEALGIKVLARYNSKQKELNLEILDSQKRSISNAKIEIRFRRMLQQELDFSAKIPFENGRYIRKIDFPALGKWQAQIVILLANGKVFQTAQDFFIREPRQKPRFFEEFLGSHNMREGKCSGSTCLEANLDNRHKSVSDCNSLKKLKNFANKIAEKDGFSEVP